MVSLVLLLWFIVYSSTHPFVADLTLPPQASVGALDFGVAVLKAPTQISFEVSNAGPVPCAWTATCPLVRRGVFSAW